MDLSEQPFHPLDHSGAGVAYSVVNPLIDFWVDCWNNSAPLLDIGCGNCLNTLEALKAGTEVYATDIDRESLAKLQQQYGDVYPHLFFYHLKLPDQVHFSDNQFSGILCSEVFHFLDHEAVIESIRLIHRLLIPGGKIILTCASEDAKMMEPLKLKQMKEAQRRAAPDRLEALANPLDYFEQLAKMHNPKHQAQEYIKLYRTIFSGCCFNLFNSDQLASAFTNAGFSVEHISMGPAPYYALWEHGDKDQVRLIARKSH